VLKRTVAGFSLYPIVLPRPILFLRARARARYDISLLENAVVMTKSLPDFEQLVWRVATFGLKPDCELMRREAFPPLIFRKSRKSRAGKLSL